MIIQPSALGIHSHSLATRKGTHSPESIVDLTESDSELEPSIDRQSTSRYPGAAGSFDEYLAAHILDYSTMTVDEWIRDTIHSRGEFAYFSNAGNHSPQDGRQAMSGVNREIRRAEWRAFEVNRKELDAEALRHHNKRQELNSDREALENERTAFLEEREKFGEEVQAFRQAQESFAQQRGSLLPSAISCSREDGETTEEAFQREMDRRLASLAHVNADRIILEEERRLLRDSEKKVETMAAENQLEKRRLQDLDAALSCKDSDLEARLQAVQRREEVAEKLLQNVEGFVKEWKGFNHT